MLGGARIQRAAYLSRKNLYLGYIANGRQNKVFCVGGWLRQEKYRQRLSSANFLANCLKYSRLSGRYRLSYSFDLKFESNIRAVHKKVMVNECSILSEIHAVNVNLRSHYVQSAFEFLTLHYLVY